MINFADHLKPKTVKDPKSGLNIPVIQLHKVIEDEGKSKKTKTISFNSLALEELGINPDEYTTVNKVKLVFYSMGEAIIIMLEEDSKGLPNVVSRELNLQKSTNNITAHDIITEDLNLNSSVDNFIIVKAEKVKTLSGDSTVLFLDKSSVTTNIEELEDNLVPLAELTSNPDIAISLADDEIEPSGEF